MILAPNLFAVVDAGGSHSVPIDVVNVVTVAMNMFVPNCKFEQGADFEREKAKRRYFQVIGYPGFNHFKTSSFSLFLLILATCFTSSVILSMRLSIITVYVAVWSKWKTWKL